MSKELSPTAKALLEHLRALPKGSKIYSENKSMGEDILELWKAGYLEHEGFAFKLVDIVD